MATILDKRMEEDISEDVEEFYQFYRGGGLKLVQGEIEREMLSEDPENIFFVLFNQQGHIIFSSDLSSWRELDIYRRNIAQSIEKGEVEIQSLTLGEKDHAITTGSTRLDNDLYILLGESTEEQAELLEIVVIIFAVLLLMAIPAAVLVGFWMARTAARGIKEVSLTAERIKLGHMERRVQIKAEDVEIQILIDTFNAMLDRIHDLITEMREMTDNVAHDMRSPLARIRAISETAISSKESTDAHKKSAADIIQECDRLLQMVNTTLDVAEAEAGAVNFLNEMVNVSQLVDDACELFETVAEEKGIALESELGKGCQIYGHVPNLQRMLANIIDNAIKHTPNQGHIKVTLECDQECNRITVADTGVGISKDDQKRIFERFYRCDFSRTHSGCGLGLSFSRAVARAHGGDITVTSESESGSQFIITLPTASPHAAPSTTSSITTEKFSSYASSGK